MFNRTELVYNDNYNLLDLIVGKEHMPAVQ